jgi:hypothetical protein
MVYAPKQLNEKNQASAGQCWNEKQFKLYIQLLQGDFLLSQSIAVVR